MFDNNAFGQEIDDDGLPKYSPDRKNIAAFHMYKLGLTDKLPDPEDTHTPFFRTPSYYAEKAEKERQAQADIMAMPKLDIAPLKQPEFPKLAQANSRTRTDIGMPPLIQPAAPANRHDTSPSPWEKLINTLGHAYMQLNNSTTADDIRHYSDTNKPARPENNATPSPVTQNKPAAFAATPLQGNSQPQATKPVNPDNPDCLPRETSFVPKKDDLKNPYPFTRELTHDINRRLTEKLECKPYGIDFAQISQWEGGNQNKTYVPWNKGSKGNNSGVTVGSGVDFGQKNRQTLKRMGLSDELIGKLQNHLGLRQGVAKSYNNSNPITFSWDEIGQINRGASLMHGEEAIRHWDSRIQQSKPLYPNAPLFHEMTSPQQTLVFSRYYHQGPGWIQKHPELFESIRQNNWDRVRERWDKLIDENTKNGNGSKAKRLQDERDYFWPRNKLNNK